MRPSPTQPGFDRSGKAIAVVDDLEDLAETLVMLLEAEGYVADYALTGAAGVALVNKMGAHAVLLDYMLPDMTGGQVANALLADPTTSLVKILMCTSTAESIVRHDFSAYHAFLLKPIERGPLLLALEAALAS